MTQTKARDIVIREDEVKALLRPASAELGGQALAALDQPGLLASPPFVAALGQAAHDLETWLDDFDARNNRTFVILGELVASVRGLAAVRGLGLHVSRRLPLYHRLVDGQPLVDDLERAGQILDRAIHNLLGALHREAGRLGLTWEAAAFDGTAEVSQRQRRLLPRNLDEEETVDERQHIAEIGARFLKVLQTSRSLDLGFARPREVLAEFVATSATEERCRWYESSVHSIQSMYDTYVLQTSVERDHPWLQALRGHASVSLHLLEMATALVHFYERHENDVRHEPARQVISEVVSKEDVLDVAVNVCLRHAYLYVESASATAHQILRTFVRQASARLAMPAQVTLHARPLALIVQVARHYGTPLEIALDGEKCSAASLMSLILVGGRHPRPRDIEVTGDARALRDLELLFEAGLGETGARMPPELDYLKTTP
jgi:phosphotransferase system HPr-like phosphotransfer protein